MTGKQHLSIGIILGLGAGIVFSLPEIKSINSINIESIKSMKPIINTVISTTVVSGLSALLPDIDSKASIASQNFSRAVTVLLVLFGLVSWFKPALLQPIRTESYSWAKQNIFISIFMINIILGKLSPHRGYTHRVIGTSVFLLCAFMLLSSKLFISFSLGYLVAHILADGEGIRFFEPRLPFISRKGKLKIQF
jgi:inner membrane protein